MATAAETFTWAAYEALLKAYLGIVVTDTSEDARLQPWLEAAALDCDDFCGWKYTDLDGEAVDVTPSNPALEPLIKMGVYEWVRVFRIVWTARSVGLKSARTGPIGETLAAGAAGIIPAVIARAHVEALWAGYVHNPLIMGKGYGA